MRAAPAPTGDMLRYMGGTCLLYTSTPETVERAFRQTFSVLDRRIMLFMSLPLRTLDELVIQSEIDRIGKQ